jgi:hypothetical protein
VRRAYDKKCSKLAAWKKAHGARTVLILEENDIQITNHELVGEAVRQVEASLTDLPDEVWLVSTAINTLWNVWWLRSGGRYCEDLSCWGSSLSEADPLNLLNITGRTGWSKDFQ